MPICVNVNVNFNIVSMVMQMHTQRMGLKLIPCISHWHNVKVDVGVDANRHAHVTCKRNFRSTLRNLTDPVTQNSHQRRVNVVESMLLHWLPLKRMESLFHWFPFWSDSICFQCSTWCHFTQILLMALLGKSLHKACILGELKVSVMIFERQGLCY